MPILTMRRRGGYQAFFRLLFLLSKELHVSLTSVPYSDFGCSVIPAAWFRAQNLAIIERTSRKRLLLYSTALLFLMNECLSYVKRMVCISKVTSWTSCINVMKRPFSLYLVA